MKHNIKSAYLLVSESYWCKNKKGTAKWQTTHHRFLKLMGNAYSLEGLEVKINNK